MRVLVISQCTKSKSDEECMAIDMYQGVEHKKIVEGLRYVWGRPEIHGNLLQAKGYDHSLHYYIVSAGHGLVKCWDKIKPYDFSFSYMFRDSDIKQRANVFRIHEKTESLINQYDMVFFLLGKNYLTALDLPLEVGRNLSDRNVSQYFLIAPSDNKMVPDGKDIHRVPSGNEMREIVGGGRLSLKGEMFRRICYATNDEGFGVFERIRANPNCIRDIMRNHVKSSQMGIFDKL